ncbi:MAG: acyltransferase family protein, partial [Negativicutes bacterium]|nr:acyltransferase family protein [Negativicutes bacterium]
YYSSYILHPLSTNFYLNLILQYRLSYWVAHYVFIFVLGAVCAIKYEEFLAFTRRRLGAINVFFYLSLIGMLLFYYYLLFIRNYTPEAAVNTAHQLSPIGVLYTYAATLFWFSLFSHKRFSSHITLILQRLGDNSYMVYLVHPFVMYYLINYLTNHAIIMTVPVVISFFTLTVLISLCIAFIEKRLSKYIPLLSTLLLGSKISRL